MEKRVNEMLKKLRELNEERHTAESLEEGLTELWKMQDRLKEVERKIIKGEIAEVRIDATINVKGFKKEEED